MSSYPDFNKKLEIADIPESQEEGEKPSTSSTMSGDRPKRAGRKPGRRSSKMDVRAKLERSRQSARECRARKKMRYQYLEDLVANREKAVFALRNELEMYKQWCLQVDKGLLPLMLLSICQEEIVKDTESKMKRTGTPQSAPYQGRNSKENQGTSLAMHQEEANGLELRQSKEMNGKDQINGATGGPGDHVLSQSSLNLEDILSLISTGESTVFGNEDRKQSKGDHSENHDVAMCKGDNSRDNVNKSKGGNSTSIPSLFRNIATGGSYFADEDEDEEIDVVSDRTSPLETIVEESE